MSFREKSAWISVLSMLGIYGLYFWPVIRSRGGASGVGLGGLLGTVIALVIVQVVLTVAVAIFDPRDAKAPPDERDKLIELRATRVAYAALAASVACACFFAGFHPPILFTTNAFLFILVMAEVLRCACQIVQYRREA